MTDDFGMNVDVGEGIRRLPVYLLLDCSGSMTGAPIEAVRRGVELFIQETSADTFSRDTVHVGIITFGGVATLVTDGLVAVDALQVPDLVATGGTPLGAALTLLMQSIDQDLRASVPGQEKGDWKPLAFILTDGEPTDDWRGPRQALLERSDRKLVNVITVGCGPHMNAQNLKDIAIGPTFRMDDSEASFQAFFQWVTQSVRIVGRSVNAPGGQPLPSDLPAVPQVIQYIP